MCAFNNINKKKLFNTFKPSKLLCSIKRKLIKPFIIRDSPKRIFTDIYLHNHWKGTESVSGSGSTLKQTQYLRRDLEKILKIYRIGSILDIPCGDYNWMKFVEKQNIKYTGADIVKPLIKLNRMKYGQNQLRKFIVKDIIKDPLPRNDIIICRDCLVHLSFQEIFRSIKNIKKSKSKYLLATTFTNHILNLDSSRGGWRKLNMQKEPFNFPEPVYTIIEKCPEGNGEYSDKSLRLWLVCDL